MVSRAYMPPSKQTEWETPPELFDALDAEFGPFTCDPACLFGQYTAETILRRDGMICVAPGEGWRPGLVYPGVSPGLAFVDGLAVSWAGCVFLNPPYGKLLPRWIEKAVAEVKGRYCKRVVALIPARTDTKVWQAHTLREAAYDRIAAPDTLILVRFLPGRIRFVGATGPAPFPSVVVVWGK